MKLQNFESYIDSTILERGKNYFENEHIEFLQEIKKGNWHAIVSGTDDYNIEIEIGGKGSIEKYFCDCPYDGSLCKHIAAVLFAILEETTKSSAKEVGKKSNKLTFDELLEKIERQEFQDFIKNFSLTDKGFKDKFELYFSQKDAHFDLQKKYVDVIKKAINTSTSRGFIDYNATRKLSKELNQYLATANEYFVKNNFRDSFILYKILIQEVIKVLEYCDDSNGTIGDIVSEAIEEISMFLKAPISFEFKEQIVDFLKAELQNKIYFDYGDFGYNLTHTYSDFSTEVNRTAEFSAFIDSKIELAKNDDYDRKFFTQVKISFLKHHGKNEEVQNLIQENLQIPEIRALEVEKNIKKNDYAKAKRLIEEGIKIAETKNHPGTVNQWQRTLLEIAVLEKDVKTQRFFLMKFAFDRGLVISDYNQWKKTFSESEWSSIIEEKISEITKKVIANSKTNSFFKEDWLHYNLLYSLGPIFIQEKIWDRLLALVQKQSKLSTVLSYYPHLKKEYPEELLTILIPLLEKEGDICNGRSQYKELVNEIKTILKDFPKERVRILNVAQKLKDKYPRRPAMLEELNELF